tara:strand:- start:967 stop:1194 length:228 start_codon:yes stop_codon:yes gene_type:complete
MDTFALLKILSMHNGCKEKVMMDEAKSECATGEKVEKPKSKEEEVDEDRKQIVARLNEIREVVFKTYAELAKKIK